MKAPLLARAIAIVSSLALVLGGSLVGASAATADAAPAVVVTPSSNIDSTVSNTFTITGTGFTGPGAANGAYVNVGATSAWTPGTVPGQGGFLVSGWVPAASVVDGAFSTTLTVKANVFDPAVSYSVSTFAAHQLSVTDRTLDTLTPITIKSVAPAPATTTTTTLAAPASAIVGQAVTLSATVAPSAAGSVQFLDGATSLARVDVASGAASTPVTFTAAGAHSVTAVFTPTDAATFTASASAASTVTVAAVATPTVTVSKTTLSTEGETVTVTGSGFSPVGTATNGARPPLAGKFGGAYVSFGKYADVWKPSAGAASATRKNDASTLKWVVNEADTAAVGGAAAGAVPINADGSFVITMQVKPGFAGEPATGNYGVYTYGGSGLSYAPFETYTPITFASIPTVTVSKTTLGALGGTVTVSGKNFSPNAPATNGARPPLAGKFGGAYVSFGKYADVWKPSAGAASTTRKNDASTLKWVVNAEDTATVGGASAGAVAIGADGTFEITMTVKPGFTGEPATGNYGVYTYGGSGLVYAPFETYTPITFAAKPTVTVSKTTLSSEGEKVTVTGTGFLPDAPATSGARPPLAGKFAGAYVSFGKYADVWKPTDNAASTARVNDSTTTKWGVSAADLATIDPAGSGAGMVIAADGSFTLEMVVKPGFAGEPATGNYGVYTYGGGGVKYAPFETYTPITFASASTTTSVTATPSAITVGESTVVAAQVAPATAGSYTLTLGTTVLATTAVSASGAAAFTVQNLTVGTQQLTATFAPATSAYAASAGTVSVVVGPVLVPEAPPVVAPPAVGAGSLTWGVKQSFREYVAGPIARGAITTSGVSTSGGAFVFSQASGGTYDRATGTGTSAYSGSVRFTGHDGVLDVTLGNPVVRVDSATSGTLLVTSGGSQIAFATLNLAAGSLSTPNGTVTYSGVPATLTSQGVSTFALNGNGFYPAGTALDPVSFVVGAVGSTSVPAPATVASFATIANTPAATVPATTGITIAQGTSLTEGDEVTISATGFRPNEKDILVVIYSTPVVLTSKATADATGTATWTGRLPEGLSGTHTLTFQGSVDRGVEITIAAKAATTALVGCVVDDAALTWGFKESFRSYISGTIANGEWTVADGATYATPNFGFSGGTGGYDAETASGSLAFPGSITFTGHEGILNTTVSNPQLRIVDETSAVLVLDISGTTQDGATIDRKAVEFGQVDLTGAITDANGVITIADAPAVLTAAGADAFGTYPEGEALDPITATFSTAADCALPAEAADDEVSTTTADEPTAVSAADDSSDLGWVLRAAAAVVLVLRRRSATR